VSQSLTIAGEIHYALTGLIGEQLTLETNTDNHTIHLTGWTSKTLIGTDTTGAELHIPLTTVHRTTIHPRPRHT